MLIFSGKVLSLNGHSSRCRFTYLCVNEPDYEGIGRWYMCGRPLGCKRENEKSDGRIDCDHVSGLFSRRMTAGPDGIRDPAPNTSATLTSLCTKRVLWIVGSTERHLIQLFHPGITARFSQSPVGAGRLPRALSRPHPVGRRWSRLQLRSGWNTGRGPLVVHSRSKPCGG